jgi:hypothetical protein
VSTTQSKEAPRKPVEILRSVNRDGETYALSPGTKERLRATFGDDVRARSRLFISHETRADYDHVHKDIAAQVVILLTGLTEDRLRDLGGVRFLDAVTERELPRT